MQTSLASPLEQTAVHLTEGEAHRPRLELPRRSFIKLAVSSGFALGVIPVSALGAATAPSELKPNQVPRAFMKIAPNGVVTVVVNRVELGQGAHTALPMLLAEELDADWSLVRAEHASSQSVYADPIWGFQVTGGSASTRNSYAHYRELGARARAMLVQAAAARWGTDVGHLRTEQGVVFDAQGRRMTYGELAADAMALPVPADVKLKDAKDFRLIGKPLHRLDSPSKSTGRQDFSIDVNLPGQLTALVAHPPVFGAKVKPYDDSGARAAKGVRAVIRIPLVTGGEGVAIVAETLWKAKMGFDALKLEWDDSGVEKVDSTRQLAAYREIVKRPGKVAFEADLAPLANASRVIKAEFTFPYLAHAMMEPITCTVSVTDAGAEVWVGSQFPGVDAAAAARILGLDTSKVKLNVMMTGGGFGRRGIADSDFVSEACQIAKAARLAGVKAPIRMIWGRYDDIKGGYYRPMHLHRAEIAFDAKGRVLAWDHRIVGQSIMSDSFQEPAFLKDGVDSTTIEGMRDPYDVPMHLTVHHPKLNVPVQAWRSVGHTHTAFVMETLIDEICRRTEQDPVAYRMRMFGTRHERHRAALQLAVDKSGYGRTRLKPGRAWGIAVHEAYESVVAYVVEASIKNGTPVLHKVTAGVHCNLAVNPRMVEAQVEGAAVMGLSMCLPGSAITLKDGVIEQSNFNDYTVARITDMPKFETHIVPSLDTPTGMGEPGLPPLAPAFANALARLTGKSIRSLPFKLA